LLLLSCPYGSAGQLLKSGRGRPKKCGVRVKWLEVGRLGNMAARSDAARQRPPGHPGLQHTSLRPPSVQAGCSPHRIPRLGSLISIGNRPRAKQFVCGRFDHVQILVNLLQKTTRTDTKAFRLWENSLEGFRWGHCRSKISLHGTQPRPDIAVLGRSGEWKSFSWKLFPHGGLGSKTIVIFLFQSCFGGASGVAL